MDPAGGKLHTESIRGLSSAWEEVSVTSARWVANGSKAGNIYVHIYTSAKIWALRAPFFSLLGFVMRGPYILVHFERTTTS